LKEIASERNMTLAELVRAIDGNRQHANLSSVAIGLPVAKTECEPNGVVR
jgi:predicted DNA-binding ribbon-helix-helix protein